MFLAEYCAAEGHTVCIVEREQTWMQRASFHNQARVHMGYHYPRSVLTALRSSLSFPVFVDEFQDCVVSDFEKYYMIGKTLGKLTGLQFQKFCERINARCEPAPQRIQRLTTPRTIEACFAVKEYAFDALRLKSRMAQRLAAAKVQCLLGASMERLEQVHDELRVTIRHAASGEEEILPADHVFNCTYAQLNEVTRKAGLEAVPLKHEVTEMCLVEVPDVLKNVGITVMCGPFFSCMPFPPAGMHSFSHVRYTPHYAWEDGPEAPGENTRKILDDGGWRSAWPFMQKDAARYIPVLEECRYRDSLWEIKTILPRSESDDSRPILFRPNHGIKGFHCVMGGKIDNVYDVVAAIASSHLLEHA